MTEVSRIVDQPEPGFFRLRLVRGGPWVCARIFLPCPFDIWSGEPTERPRQLLAEIDEEGDLDPAIGMRLVAPHRVWHYGEVITAREFAFLRADAKWARHNSPTDPKAQPRKKVDPLDIPRLFA